MTAVPFHLDPDRRRRARARRRRRGGRASSARRRPSAPAPVTAAQDQRWKTELSNWGRWGKDDQIGTLNLITPAKRREAAALVRDGVSVSLAADADTEKAVDNPSPYEHAMLGIGSDRIGIAYHGIAHTHLDAWNHIHANGVFYNGYTPDAGRGGRGRATSATRSSTSRTASSRAAS